MASVVLGKRHRAAVDASAVSSPILSRKRRAQAPLIHNDIKDNQSSPSTSRTSRRGQLPVDIFADQENATRKDGSIDSPPAKYPTPGDRIALSPTKINSHFKAAKVSCDETPRASQLKTPQTSRFRDAFSKSSPITPRHRVTIVGRPLTPRTPRTPTSLHSTATVYSSARQLFAQSANPGRLVGRENERQEILTFLKKRVDSKSGGCLYISGPPGTGKSALTSEVCDELLAEDAVRMVHVNCVSIKSTKDVHDRLIESFFESSEIRDRDVTELLKTTFIANRRPSTAAYVVILDEIDHLLSIGLEVLYLLFEWSLHRNSCLILIGIANALDLTDRFLPRLKSRNLKPQLLPFLPYSGPQIASVITARLQSLIPVTNISPKEYVPFLHPAAIQLCAKKVASQTGDLRKAFDIVRRAIDIVEFETKQKHQQKIDEGALQSSPTKTILVENMNLSSPGSDAGPTPRITLASSLASLTPETAPRASIAHVARVTSAAFGNGTVQRLQNLNLQQKAALCSLVTMEKRKRTLADDINGPVTPSKTKSLAPTVKQLFDNYCLLCKRNNVLHPLTSTEFRDVIASLETLGLVNEIDGKNGSFKVKTTTPSRKGKGSAAGTAEAKQMASCISEKELRGCLEGVGGNILRSLLSGNE